MSKLQTAAKPILTPLILGEWRDVGREDAEIIAKWAVMTSISIDSDDPCNRSIPEYERHGFARNQTVPANWMIFIGIYGGVSTRGFSSHPFFIKNKWGDREALFQGKTLLIGKMVVVTHSIYGNVERFPSLLKDAFGLYQVFPDYDADINNGRKFIDAAIDLRNLDYYLTGFKNPPFLMF